MGVYNLRKKMLALTLLAGLIGPVASQGQIIFGQPAETDLGIIYCSWNINSSDDEQSLSQLSLPINGFVPLKDNFETRFYLGNAINTLDPGETKIKLSGISDFRIQFNHSFSNDKLLLSAGLNLPTGKRELDTADERTVLNYLSQNYLSFPVRRLGEGFGVNILAGAATMMGAFRVGGSLVYQYNGPYAPYENIDDYDPGDYFTVSVGAERLWEKSAASLNIFYTVNTTDKIDGKKIFRQSNSFDIRLSGRHQAGDFGLEAAGRYLVRGNNRIYDLLSNYIDRRLYGDEFSLYLQAAYNKPVKWYLAPVAEFKFIGEDEDMLGQASLFGVGAVWGYKLTNSFDFDINVKYHFGTADDGNVDLTGFQMAAGLMKRF